MGFHVQNGVGVRDTTIIQSDTVLSETNQHFRVSAGPGAGKTHWLVNHIRNVITRSGSLGPCQQIACISYTNVAAGEIIERLGETAWRVDASTIHSFLYRNLVKPYLWLLLTPDGTPLVDFSKVDGHDEHRPSRRFVEAWLKEVSSRGAHLVRELLNRNSQATFDYLRRIRWKFDPNNETWCIAPPARRAPPNYMPTRSLNSYKKHYWDAGIIDHEDVLYFAYRILDENPEIRRFIAARFPYIFIDEFQDTNPVQIKLIQWLAAAGSVVGVVGDSQQAIFGFQGASCQGFLGFNLDNFVDYRIEDNRRSTNAIVAFLNQIRRDGMRQSGLRNEEGSVVKLLVGETKNAVKRMAELDGDQLVVLARSNDEVRRLRGDESKAQIDPWQSFEKADLNSGRPGFFERLLTSCELASSERFGEGVSLLGRAICNNKGRVRKPFRFEKQLTKTETTGFALALLEILFRDYSDTMEKTVLEVYEILQTVADEEVPGLKMQGYRQGKGKVFAETTVIRDLIASISLAEDTRNCRTIHKAKSAEFSSVLVCMTENKFIEHVLVGNSFDDEEQRISYVAMSRTKDQLAISIPTLSKENERKLQEYPLIIIRL